MRLAFDIETNGLLTGDKRDPAAASLTKIHCAVTQDMDSGVVKRFWGTEVNDLRLGWSGSLMDMLSDMGEASLIVSHGGQAYDWPVIHRFYPHITVPTWPVHQDTLIMGATQLPRKTLMSSDFARVRQGYLEGKLIGSHSLKAWGQRHRFPKGEPPEDWGELTEEMVMYCARDVELTVKHYKFLEGRGWPG